MREGKQLGVGERMVRTTREKVREVRVYLKICWEMLRVVEYARVGDESVGRKRHSGIDV